MPESVRLERAAEAAQLSAEGLVQREIADRMGLSRSYVSALLTDPTGDGDRRRKADYAGTCESCGGATSGGDGPAHVPRFCRECAPDQYRKWTRERIIDAIQEWARRFGSAPTASDWGTRNGVHKCRVAEDGYEFPWAATVYDNSGGRWKPMFESWAEAIEAAGFPRPAPDRNYTDRDRWEVANMSPSSTITRPYLVFRVEDDGRLALLAETQARNSAEAIESGVQESGTFAAVAKSSLTEYIVAAKFVATARRNGGPPKAVEA